MADTSASGSNGVLYKCEYCELDQHVSLEDVESAYDEDDIAERIISEMSDVRDIQPLNILCFANMKLKIHCKGETCEGLIDVVVKFKAVPEWDSDGDTESEDDESASFEEFFILDLRNIKILEVLPRDAKEDAYFDDDYDEDYECVPEIDLSEEPTEVRSLTLCTIARTRMNNGYCHLGLDLDAERIYRPVYRIQEARCCWDRPLELDNQYTFQVLRSPNDPVTPLPHGNEDLLVDPQPRREPSVSNASSQVFQALQTMAKSTVEDIFGADNIKQYQRKPQFKYVEENTNCPSVGVLRCKGRDLRIRIFRDKKSGELKKRIRIGRYFFSIKVKGEEIPNQLQDLPTLVILGLARPWAGQDGETPFQPKRCTIICLRILQ